MLCVVIPHHFGNDYRIVSSNSEPGHASVIETDVDWWFGFCAILPYQFKLIGGDVGDRSHIRSTNRGLGFRRQNRVLSSLAVRKEFRALRQLSPAQPAGPDPRYVFVIAAQHQ